MTDDLIRKSDVLETYADLYDIFDDNKAIQEELHKVFDKINDIPAVEPSNSEKPNNCDDEDVFEYCPRCGMRMLSKWYEPQRDCFLCKWLGEVDVCGRCRNRNLFAEADTEPKPNDEPQTECPWK